MNMSAAVKNNDLAIITIGKSAGEFLDRKISDSFNLTKEEKDMISGVCNAFHKAVPPAHFKKARFFFMLTN